MGLSISGVAETTLGTAAGTLDAGVDPLFVASDGSGDSDVLEASVFDSLFKEGSDVLGGNNFFSNSESLNAALSSDNNGGDWQSEINQSNSKISWSIKSESLFDSLKQTTDPYRDSVSTLNQLTETKFESSSIDQKFNLFDSRQQEPIKKFALWDETDTKSTQEEAEPLSWGWSLKSETRPRKPKSSGLWD